MIKLLPILLGVSLLLIILIELLAVVLVVSKLREWHKNGKDGE